MKKTVAFLSILSAAILSVGCGTTSASKDTAQKKNSSQETTSAISETTTAVSGDNAAETTTAATADANTSVTEAVGAGTAGNNGQGVAVSNEQNSGNAQTAGSADPSAESGNARTGGVELCYQAKYQSLIIDMIDEASGSDSFFIDYTLKDLTGDGVPELIVNHGDVLFNTVITIYNSDMKVLGDGFRGSDTAFYENTNGELAFVTTRMGMFYALYLTYDAASDSIVTGSSKDASYSSVDEIGGILQNEGLTALEPVSITVNGGSVRSEYGGQTFDYPYLGIIK